MAPTQNHNPKGQADKPAVLRRIWWTSTAIYEFQPFCAAELKNKPSSAQYNTTPATAVDSNNKKLSVKIKGDVVIGCDTGALLFYEMNAV